MNSYELSRKWFDFCFDNPEKITSNHTALYFFIIEHCNRLGWKSKFGLPSQMAMDAIGIKNWRTYSKALNELIDFGFIQCIQKSKNQYSATVIAIVKNTKATTKALDKAMQKHDTKQDKSIAYIVKPNNLITKEQLTKEVVPPTQTILNFIESEHEPELVNGFREFVVFLNETKHVKNIPTQMTISEYKKTCDEYGRDKLWEKIESLDNWLDDPNVPKGKKNKKSVYHLMVNTWLKKGY